MSRSASVLLVAAVSLSAGVLGFSDRGSVVPMIAVAAAVDAAVAERNCLEAVAKETQAKNVSTLRIDQSEAAIEVYVQVEGAEAPWKCLAAPDDGSVQEITYTSEG